MTIGAMMRPNHQQGHIEAMRYLMHKSVVGILLLGLLCSYGSFLYFSHQLLHPLVTQSMTTTHDQFETSMSRPSVQCRSMGGFQFLNGVSNKTLLLTYSQFNPSIYAQRDRIKFFLNATHFGKFSARDFIKRKTSSPLRVPGGLKSNAWMIPFLAPGFDWHMPRFLQLSKRWLGDDGDFHPRILKELFKKIQKPLEQNEIFWSRKNLTDRNLSDMKGVNRYQSCAVVGNSGILLNGTYGKEIDNHQIVIRLNNAIVGRPYTTQVGSNTNISFINSNIFKSHSRGAHCWWHRYGNKVPIILYICQASHLLHIASCATSPRVYTIIVTHSHFDALCGAIAKWYSLTNFMQTTRRPLYEWDSFHDEFEFHYSSGLQAVVLALGICDKVDLYGFGKSHNARHHYYNAQKQELTLHDYAAEYLFYNDLVLNRTIPFLIDAGISIPPVQIFY